MKTAAIYHESFLNRPLFNCPNGATRRQVLQKLLDRMLITASCLGVCSILLYLFLTA